MKISKTEREKKLQRLLGVAGVYLARTGAANARLAELAAQARIPAPTVYRYFDSISSVCTALLLEHSRRALAAAQGVTDWSRFTLGERLQCLGDAWVESFGDPSARAPGAISARKAWVADLLAHAESPPAELVAFWSAAARTLLAEAHARGEIAELPPGDWLSSLYWDYQVAALRAWIRSSDADEAPRWIDHSAALIVSVLRGGVINAALSFGLLALRGMLSSETAALVQSRARGGGAR